MAVLHCPFCDAPLSQQEATDPCCGSCGKKLSPEIAQPAAGLVSPGHDSGLTESRKRNNPGIGSLLCCAVACALLLVLMLLRASKHGWHNAFPWGEYLWIV